jgi:hypothetical protein
VPKNESNDRFSCMMTTTWRILPIPLSACVADRAGAEGEADPECWAGAGGWLVQPTRHIVSSTAVTAAVTPQGRRADAVFRKCPPSNWSFR